MSLHDPTSIDAQLRKVPLPEGMLARLKQIVSLSDADLDAELRDVPVPAGLGARLLQIAEMGDEEMDFQLRDVPLPPRMLQRLVRSRQSRSRTLPWARLAIAASLLIAVGLYYAGSMGDFVVASYRAFVPSPQQKTVPADARHRATAERQGKEGWQHAPNDAAANPAITPPSPDLDSELAIGSTGANDRPLVRAVEPPGGDGAVDAILTPDESSMFAAPVSLDEFNELVIVAGLSPRGVAAPPVRQFDHLFERKHGVHPFVDPAAHALLRTSRVPLVTDTTSFDLVRHSLKNRELPVPDAVRVEEFLAAMDYDFPAPSGRALAIRTAAGPSVFAGQGLQLLQVGVQAMPLIRDPAEATHLTIAVDVSGSMRGEGRLDVTRRALAALVRQLGPRDRLAIVACGEQAEVLLEDAGLNEAEAIQAAIGSLKARGSTNLWAGLQAATHVAAGTPAEPGRARRLVLLTDGLAELNGRTIKQIEGLVASATAGGVSLRLIALGGQEPNQQLSAVVQAGGEAVQRATTSEQVRAALLETLAGRPQLIANHAFLEVAFNPAAVATYRLLGHEAQAGGGLLAGSLEAELRAGQAATALYEISLKPNGIDDVAVAKLSWRDTSTGRQHHATQRISRLQFAGSFASSPLSLQTAALAAETAQILGQSYFAPPNTHSLDQVLQLANRANPRLQQNPSFLELKSLVDQALRARPAAEYTLD